MREWPYTTWSGDVYNTHCGSRFPLALAKSVVRRGCSLFNPTHSSSRQCMFVLMYEHCMYIVQSFHLTVFYLKSIAMIQCKLGKQNFWNKVEYPWVLSTPLETLGFFQTNEKAFPCRCFPFGSLLKKVYLYWLKILRQSLLKFVDSSPLFDICLPRLDLILNSPLSQYQFGFCFYFIHFRPTKTWLTTQTKSNEKL